jgi:hypothetical protein
MGNPPSRSWRHPGIHSPFFTDALMKVFEKGGVPVQARLEQGVYALRIPLAEEGP